MNFRVKKNKMFVLAIVGFLFIAVSGSTHKTYAAAAGNGITDTTNGVAGTGVAAEGVAGGASIAGSTANNSSDPNLNAVGTCAEGAPNNYTTCQ